MEKYKNVNLYDQESGLSCTRFGMVLDPRGKQLANQCEKVDPFISYPN